MPTCRATVFSRVSLLALILLTATACFEPFTPQGLACSSTGACPEGQSCGTDGICRSDHSLKPDCLDDDPGCNLRGEPDTDNSAFRGLIRQKDGDGRWIGTLVSPTLALTCGKCLESLSAEQLEFRMGGVISTVSEIRYPTNSEHDAALIVLDRLFSAGNLQLATSGPASGSDQLAILPKSDELEDQECYAVEIETATVSASSYLFTSMQMEAPFSCTLGGPALTQQNTVLAGVQIASPAPCGAGGGFLAQRVDVLAEWIDEQIDAEAPEDCDDFVVGPCGIDCGIQTCSLVAGEVMIGCEIDTSKCDDDETCNAGTNFTCESDLLCTPSTKVNEEGCGTCGDQYCDTSGSGYVCWEDSSECSGSQTCVSNGATWNCQAAQICTPNQWYSCGGCGQRQCNSSGSGYGSCQSQGDATCSSGQFCDAEAVGGLIIYNCTSCSSTCGGCGCDKGNGVCNKMQHWCSGGDVCEPEFVGAFTIYNCI